MMQVRCTRADRLFTSFYFIPSAHIPEGLPVCPYCNQSMLDDTFERNHIHELDVEANRVKENHVDL